VPEQNRDKLTKTYKLHFSINIIPTVILLKITNKVRHKAIGNLETTQLGIWMADKNTRLANTIRHTNNKL